MSSTATRLACFAVVILVAAACGSRASVAPDAAADITGTITRATARQIVVEENPAEASGSAKAAVTIAAGTVITSDSGRRPTLATGQRVSVWFDGPVAESYPVQATAGRIVVHD